MRRLTALFILIQLLAVSFFVSSENIFILTPYIGPNTHSYENDEYDMESEGTGLLTGLYFQMVNPERFQWNTFLYYSPETNHSRIFGGHFIFDYYFLKSPLGKFVAGTGIEYIDVKMEAGDEFSPLQDFNMDNRVFVNYYRAGYKFSLPTNKLDFSLFPWAGFQYDIVNGSVDFEIPAGPMSTMPMSSNIDENEVYTVAGLNFKVNILHFIDLEAKYRGTFNSDDYLSTYSALANVYITRNLGVSYRFKYAEQSSGFERYHLFGVILSYQ